MKQLKLLVPALLLLLLLPSPDAYAHVFFRDETGKIGMIMHVTPDDDPIAGEESSLYFDIKSATINDQTHTFRLSVSDSAGQKSSAAVYLAGGSAVTAKHVFPTQGVYELTLVATPVYSEELSGVEPTVFNHTQRVSRGRNISPLDQPRYEWAELGMILSLATLLVVILIVVTKRRIILSYTKWK